MPTYAAAAIIADLDTKLLAQHNTATSPDRTASPVAWELVERGELAPVELGLDAPIEGPEPLLRLILAVASTEGGRPEENEVCLVERRAVSAIVDGEARGV